MIKEENRENIIEDGTEAKMMRSEVTRLLNGELRGLQGIVTRQAELGMCKHLLQHSKSLLVVTSRCA